MQCLLHMFWQHLILWSWNASIKVSYSCDRAKRTEFICMPQGISLRSAWTLSGHSPSDCVALHVVGRSTLQSRENWLSDSEKCVLWGRNTTKLKTQGMTDFKQKLAFRLITSICKCNSSYSLCSLLKCFQTLTAVGQKDELRRKGRSHYWADAKLDK